MISQLMYRFDQICMEGAAILQQMASFALDDDTANDAAANDAAANAGGDFPR